MAADSDLAGAAVADVGATVVAVRPAEGPVEPLPDGTRSLLAGDSLYLVGDPGDLRRIEAAAG
ncbi:MAG: hypothetical protein ABEJ08_02250 [Halobacteriaceae archaeon]